jgi:hypothetical protein
MAEQPLRTITAANIDDARMMISYAASRGKKIPAGFIESLEGLAEHGKSNHLAHTKNFWQLYAALSSELRPVTADSLRACLELVPGTPSIAGRAARRYSRWAYAVLILVFAFQGYWFLLNSVIDNLRHNQDIVKQYSLLMDATRKKLTDEIKGDPTFDQVRAAMDKHLMDNAAILQARTDKKDETSFRLLTADEEQLVKISQRSSLNALGNLSGWLSWIIYPKNNSDAFFYFDMQASNVQDLGSAQFILDILNRFILPTLFGLTGASLYIIRRLAAEIQAATYTKDLDIAMNLRFFLGGFAGLAIGWLALPNSTTAANLSGPSSTIFASLSPLALSFIAGYAVEIFFHIVDRLISSFTTTPSKLVR